MAVVSRRGGSTGRVGPLSWGLLILVLFTPLQLSDARPQAEPRSVAVVFAVDDRFREDPAWLERLGDVLGRASRYYGPRFGLRFELADVQFWRPAGDTLEERLDDLRAQAQPGAGGILVGVTARPPRPPAGYGLASYQEGLLVIALAAEDDGLAEAFRHEVAHVFGALDLGPGRGLMSSDRSGEELDALNARLVALHRDREFAPHAFPLPAEAFDEAVRLYRQAAAQSPAASLAIAQLAIEQGDYGRALEAASDAMAAEPGDVDAINLRGIALRRLGRVEEAIAAYRRALSRRPRAAMVHYNLAIALEKSRDPDGALAAYQRAVELQPGHVRALSNLARLHAQRGEARQAIEAAALALEIAPDFAEARVNLALGHFKAGDLERARQEVDGALAASPSLPGAHEVLGAVLMAAGRAEDAATSFRTAAALEPLEPRYRLQLATALQAAGRRDEARRAFEEVVKLDPDDAYSHHNLAVLCFRLGDLTRARAHVNRAIALGVTPHPEFIAALEAAERRRFLPARPRATSRARP